MSQIDQLQRRIAVALDRIGQGLEGMQGSGGADAAGVDALRRDLEEEKTANLQLRERVQTLKKRRNEAVESYEKLRTGQSGTIQRLDAELQSLRKANQQLRDNNLALRDAISTGVSEPHLINKSMMAELEGLRATHAAERAEAEAILQELARAIETAPGGETENAEPEKA